jgi:hypothetical protein
MVHDLTAGPSGVPAGHVGGPYLEFERRGHAVAHHHAIRLLLLPVFVEIDETRRHDVASCIDDALPGEWRFRDRVDLPGPDADVAHGVEPRLGIHDASVGDDEVVGRRRLLRGQRQRAAQTDEGKDVKAGHGAEGNTKCLIATFVPGEQADDGVLSARRAAHNRGVRLNQEMPPPISFRLPLATVALLASVWIAHAAASAAPSDVAALIARVSERVAAYYQRAQRIICTERSTVVPIGADGSVPVFARTVESELRIEVDGWLDPRVTREVQRVNGREPRERDKTDRSGCTDPSPLAPELLSFLLPAERDGYRFTTVRQGRERGYAALVVDFASAQRSGRPELITDDYGHEDCFDWTGPIAVRGRLWIDAGTHDVLRLDRYISGPTDVRVPSRLQSRYHFPPWLTIDRDDITLRFKPVTFTDPDETMLLPESIDSQTVVRTGLQSTRRAQVFSNYRRFLTSSRIR